MNGLVFRAVRKHVIRTNGFLPGMVWVDLLLRKACEARVNRRLRRYYLIVRLLPNVFALACLPLSLI